MQAIRIAFRNIARQKKRTVLLGGAIAFGVLIIAVMGSLSTGILENVRENFTGIFGGHIYVKGEELAPSGRILPRIGDRAQLDEALTAAKDQVVAYQVRSQGRGTMIFGSKEYPVLVSGVDGRSEKSLWNDLGIPMEKRVLLTRENALVLPQSIASSLGVEVGESLLFKISTITGQANVGEFTLAAIYPSNQDFVTEAYTSLAYLNSLLGLAADAYQSLNITVRNIEEIDLVASRLYNELKRVAEVEPRDSGNAGGFTAVMKSFMQGTNQTLGQDAPRWQGTKFIITTLNDLMQPILSLVQSLVIIRLGLFAVLLVIIMVGLLNSFRMILLERTQEIGTMRALGMQRESVRNIFLLEALFLALVGAVAGLLVCLSAYGRTGSLPGDRR